MINRSKHIEELLAIETYWDSTHESTPDAQERVWYSNDGSRVVKIDKLVEECEIPYGVKVICDKASQIGDEPLLVDLKLPESLVAIGAKAFLLQQSLDNFLIPRSVEIIKEEAFKLANIEGIPDDNGVKIFGDGSFEDSFIKGDIKLKNAVCIGAFALSNTEISSVELSDSLDIINDCAFAKCANLTSITIPKSVKYIGGGIVAGCANLERIELLCDGYIIEDGIIYNSDKTELVSAINPKGKVKVPHGVKRIRNGAFYATDITSVTIPRSVNSIGDYAFACSKLQSITIPNSVAALGKKIFSECYDLKKVKLPDGLTAIESETFEECNELANITIPDSVTRIGESAFICCGKLTEICLPESVVEIGREAFACCDNLKSINIPSKVTLLGDSALYYTAIKSIIIPDSVTKIDDNLFYDSQLKYIELPESIETISDSAFECCDDIYIAIKRQSAIREMVTSALNRTKKFYYGDQTIGYKIITKRHNPKLFKHIDYVALGLPSKLEIPDGITKIANMEFASCIHLESITIPRSVKEIDGDMLYIMDDLKQINLHKDCPIKNDLISMYGKTVTLLPSD